MQFDVWKVGRCCTPAAKEPRRAPVESREAEADSIGARHGSFAVKGMQQRPTFLVLDITISAIEQIAPLVVTIRRFDGDLAKQIREATSSIALNIGEGNRSDGGNRRARFSTAAGSNAEVRAALRVAVAWGYVRNEDVAAVDALLDRVGAMLYRLGARR